MAGTNMVLHLAPVRSVEGCFIAGNRREAVKCRP